MTGELEVHHSPQLRFLLCTHYLFTHILIGNAVGIGTGLCIRTQVLEIIRHCVVEQRQAVIEDGCRGDNFARVIVPQQAEVAEVSVLVVNQGIENQHTAKLLVELVAQGLVIIKAGFQRRLAENTPDRDERGINIRKQPALGSKNTFPVFQVVLYAADAHFICDLTGIILAVRLVSGVRSALCAALIQIDAIILYKAPSLPQHTVGSQLRRGGECLPTAAHAGISHQ